MVLAAVVLAAGLTDKLDTVLDDKALDGALVAALVTDLNGEVLYRRNEKTRVMPASNQKIVSVYYALSTLGEDWRPKTRFWKEGKNIVVHAEGDPLLSEDQLKEARAALKPEAGSKILVKEAFYPKVGPGWEWDDLAFRYAAPITAFTVGKGAFSITVKNKVPTIPAWTGVVMRYARSEGDLSISYDHDRALLTAKGTPKEDGPAGQFALPSPERAAATILGGQFFRTDSVPSRAADYVIEGKPVKELAQLCLEPSDNVIAEHLMLMAAGESGDLGANSFGVAAQRMKTFYTDTVGLSAGDLRPQDGSGLSRHNLVTASGMARILRHAYTTDLRQTFIVALPQPGEGTLRRRLKGVAVDAKTGTLDAVVALSGYAKAKSGKTLVFSMIVNHSIGGSSGVRAVQDKFVQGFVDSL